MNGRSWKDLRAGCPMVRRWTPRAICGTAVITETAWCGSLRTEESIAWWKCRQNITTCCFGGEDLTTLYVTTASAHAPLGDRLAGSLFSIRTGVKGQPENRFRMQGRI